MLILAGAVAIGGCYFILPSEVHCRYQTIVILLPLTLAGNILLGRVWRIILLMTPILTVGIGRRLDSITMSERLKLAWKNALLETLTTLSESHHLLRCCFMSFRAGPAGGRRGGMRKRRSTIRQKVSILQLVWLIALLSIPQLALQVIDLSIPDLQTNIYTDLIDEKMLIYRQTCRSNRHGDWPMWVGIVLTILPYAATSFLSFQASDQLPKIFNEAKSITRSIKCVVLVVAVALPAYALSDNPDARAYLLSMIVFSVAMPPCWFVVYSKIWNIFLEKQKRRASKSIHGLLRGDLSGSDASTLREKDNQNEKAAKLALTIGKMYEEMGLVQKSITLFDEALGVWQCDPNRANKDQIGGFTVDEIDSFTPTDLEYILQLLIAKGRVNGTFNSAKETGQKNAAQAWLDALEIYERSPARTKMKDPSIVFPIFSGLFVFVKGGKIQQDKDCNFEQNLARKFVHETKIHGDPVHYTRALAMQIEIKTRLGKYSSALETFEVLKNVYEPTEHSEGISAAYGTDRSAQAFSQIALCWMQLGDMSNALSACNYVLTDLLPFMDPKNILNTTELLLPVFRILKPLGEAKRLLALFEEHVIQNFYKHFGKDGVTPALPMFKPMTLLLKMCHDPKSIPNFVETAEWVADEENIQIPDFLDSVWCKLCWAPNTVVAELCLRMANKLIEDSGETWLVEKLLIKGLKKSVQIHRKVTNVEDGVVTLPIANGMHAPVYEELREIADVMGINMDDPELNVDLSGIVEGQQAAHLPSQYFLKPVNSSNDISSKAGVSAVRSRSISGASRSQSSQHSQLTSPRSTPPNSLKVSDHASTSVSDIGKASEGGKSAGDWLVGEGQTLSLTSSVSETDLLADKVSQVSFADDIEKAECKRTDARQEKAPSD